MSTPTPPPEPDSSPTTEQTPVDARPAAPAEAQDAEAHAAAPEPLGPPPPAPHQGMPAGPSAEFRHPHPQQYPQPYPFVPRYREPWINPAKRTALALVAVGLAIVLLAGGFIVGAAVAHRHDGRHSIVVRDGFGRSGGYRVPGQGPGGLVPRPGMHLAPRLRPPAPSAPAPTSSHR